MNPPNKYRRATDSLVRALVLEAQKPVPGKRSALTHFDPNPFIEAFFRLLKKLEKSPFIWVIFAFFFIGGMSSVFDFLSRISSSLHLQTVLLVSLGSFLGIRFWIWHRQHAALRQMAQDKADSLLTMANMPWKIDRAELAGGLVGYRLVIPPEDHDIFAGSPAITIPLAAAEKADLLILAVKGDQKLLEKWSTRTLA